MRRAAIVIAATVLLLVAFLVLQRRPSSPTAERRTVETDARSPDAAPSRAAGRTPYDPAPVASTQAGRRPLAPAATEDFAARLARIERAAAAGDADAAAELGELLSLCRDYAPMTAQDVEDAIVTGMATNEPAPLIGGKPASPEFLVLLQQQGYAELDQHCAGSERVVDAARAKAAPDWLQRAVEAGRVAAMTSYARHVLVQDADAAKDADAQARRVRALDYLERAVRAGDARALQLRADAQTHGYGLAADPVGAYADIYAFARTELGRSWPPRLIELYLQALAQPLDAAQLAQAQRRGDAIWRECCAHGAR
ncbi:MAG TPA: hypothetical protein VLF18_09070 [Tahibacter sp.]|uniref:hypothetical protein n=1 Tax=Tahibacter sp. TaxID=2056211 RepID=UPI002B626307|nr:hypothetical protein [Tahibacter sp.]HSX60336.1 hypothetical protein [Tahibacter sp.]